MPYRKRSSLGPALGLVASIFFFSCANLTPLYPPRPAATPGGPVADPVPSRVVVHATIAGVALRQSLEAKMPTTGEGTVPIMGRERKFSWRRDPVSVRFDRGRIGLDVHLVATVELPVSRIEFPLDFRVLAEPVVTSAYAMRFQSTEVSVTSTDSRIKVANFAAGVLETIQKTVEKQISDFSYDLKPLLAQLAERVQKPLMLPLGDANGCAELNLLGVEAGPTVLADGIEKDLALVVAPSVTMPCQAPSDAMPSLPPLANVATL